MSSLTMTGILTYADGTSNAGLPSTPFPANLTTNVYEQGKFVVPTTAGGTAIPLGTIATGVLAYCFLINRDLTNYIDLYTAASGTIYARLQPQNGFALMQWSSGMAAPAAIAHTATCLLEYIICGP